MSTTGHIRLAFGGHEKFVFRQGWPKKAVDQVLNDPLVFSREEAFVKLGVGKNMAAAIRYWGLALGLLEDVPTDCGKSRQIQVSRLGRSLLADGGWDPYLEDIGSLWLLHWQLTHRQEGRGLLWYLVFCRYLDVEFNKLGLMEFFRKQLLQMGVETTEGMVEREVEVFLRTYVPSQKRTSQTTEESLDCPLVDLNLLRLSPEEGMYRFDIGAKPSLAVEIFGFGLCHFLSKRAAERRTMSVDECVYTPGSPGQIFKLDENSVTRYLEDLEELSRGALRLQETSGLRQIYLHSNFSAELGWDWLGGYYG